MNTKSAKKKIEALLKWFDEFIEFEKTGPIRRQNKTYEQRLLAEMEFYFMHAANLKQWGWSVTKILKAFLLLVDDGALQPKETTNSRGVIEERFPIGQVRVIRTKKDLRASQTEKALSKFIEVIEQEEDEIFKLAERKNVKGFKIKNKVKEEQKFTKKQRKYTDVEPVEPDDWDELEMDMLVDDDVPF